MSDNSRVRVSIVGVVIVALFASLFARLWFLQMGPEQSLGQVVSTLATRVIQTESPRGEILDRNGKVLAQDVAAWAVTVDRNLSSTTLDRVLGQLSEVLGVQREDAASRTTTACASRRSRPRSSTLNVPLAQQLAIREHREDYPGVNVVGADRPLVSLRRSRVAAARLRRRGRASAPAAEAVEGEGISAGDLIGRDGVEAAYESVLRGKPRRETVQVDPSGKQVGPPISVDPGTVGDNVKLTIDINVQRAAENALEEGIAARARAGSKNEKASTTTRRCNPTGGAVVVLNVHDGSVVAMASNPTYRCRGGSAGSRPTTSPC